MNWKSKFSASAALAGAVLLSSCAVSSPQTRIQSRPADYQALPEKYKALVQQGRIAEGMNRDAVWIAWGPPNRISRGVESGAKLELWRYTGLRPIYTHSIGFGAGLGYHRFGRNRGYCYDPFYDYQVGPTYVPYTAAEVKFRNGKVSGWEKVE